MATHTVLCSGGMLHGLRMNSKLIGEYVYETKIQTCVI